ncbi:MAG: energy transducer TonB [Paracoccus sp. (in: a-proteobacteria)]|uniref:energy transducer TonB family protein n=1 Tax=Paracoccus sp. TaxID=267 RepID=UPI0026E0ECB3|nr:energy transducer TonB [Paracoccus sp. (in: a-proteobacteria)]MDO5620546.1 energy transducer TonB [Paracoccus sp. (in: a-proteobacteria)]
MIDLSPLTRTICCSAAAFVVATAHIGAVFWLSERAAGAATMAPPAPVFIDLAEAPVPEPDVTPEPEDASPEPVEEQEPEVEPEPEPEHEPEPEPEPEEDVVEDSELALETSDRPVIRPERPRRIERPREERREARERPRREEPRTERRQNRRSDATTQGQRREARPRGGDGPQGGGNPRAQASWQQQVGSRISRHMSRTRIQGGRGSVTVNVSVSISANGTASARLASSTGNPAHDAALSRQAARMPRMPAPPNGTGGSFTQPVTIQIR